MDLDSVADELYAVVPDEFMALRIQRAADARDAGERALAKEIASLRRPTKSGWLVNLLARRAPEELQSLIDLGEALREAQEHLRGPDLRRLSAERHRAVDALARRAASLASEAGQSTSEAVRQEVAGTLQAALADPSAAEVVLAGRVVSSITYGGFGTIDLGGAPTVTRRGGSTKATKAAPTGRTTSDVETRAAAERQTAIEEAEGAHAVLAEALAAAERSRDAAAADAAEAEATEVDVRQQVDDLRSDLQQAEEALTEAETARAATQEALGHTEQERDRARHDHAEAETLLARLREA